MIKYVLKNLDNLGFHYTFAQESERRFEDVYAKEVHNGTLVLTYNAECQQNNGYEWKRPVCSTGMGSASDCC